MTLQATTASISLAATLLQAVDLGSAQATMRGGLSVNFSDGTGAGKANKVFADTATLAASATAAIDLNGTLLDAFGAVVSFTKIRALVITAAAGNTNDVQVGGAAANGFIAPFGAATDKIKVKPGGAFALIAPDVNGYGVTAATADLLQITNGGAGTGVTYSIIVIGE